MQTSSSSMVPHGKVNQQPKVGPPKKKNTGIRRRLRFVFILFLCFAGWAVATVWDRQVTLDGKRAEWGDIQNELEQAELVQAEYEHEIARLNDPEYIEQLLRKEHLLTREGETLFIKTR